MKQIELKALAKINLGLDVLGRRENGYHDVTYDYAVYLSLR